MKLKRMISFVLALVILCGTIPGVALEANAVEDYRTWAQADSRWGYLPLGGSSVTVASHGCLATATTKLIIQAGLKNASSFNVGSFVTWMNNYGGFTASGDMYWGVPEAYGFTNHGDILPYDEYSSSAHNNLLLSWIRSGFHLILSVNDRGHYVAVDEAKSLSTGQVYIMDSLSHTANADVALSSRYATFNSVHAYTGGSTTYNESNVADYKRGATVISWGANIWSKPYSSGDSKRVYTADKDASVSVVAKVTNSSGGLWYKLTDGNWVYSANVRITDYDPNDVEAVNKTFVVTSWGANIWSKPYSTGDSQVIRSAAKTAVLNIVGRVRNSNYGLWYRLADGGWVYSYNVSERFYDPSKVIAFNRSATVMTNGGANVWSQPSNAAPSTVARVAKYDSKLNVSAKYTNSAGGVWYQLTDGNWVYGKNIRITDYDPADVQYGNKTVTVTSWGANVWSKPYSSGDSCVVKTVAKGAGLRVIAQVRNSAYGLWYQLHDGGWIYSKNVAVK